MAVIRLQGYRKTVGYLAGKVADHVTSTLKKGTTKKKTIILRSQ